MHHASLGEREVLQNEVIITLSHGTQMDFLETLSSTRFWTSQVAPVVNGGATAK